MSVWTWFFVKKTLSLTWCSRNHFAHLCLLQLIFLLRTHIHHRSTQIKFAPFVFFCWKLTCFIQILPNTFPRIFSNILRSRKNCHAFNGGGMRRAWLMASVFKIFRVFEWSLCGTWGSVSPLMGVSKNRGGPPKWMMKIMENPIKIDDLGVPLFLATPS